MKFFGLHVISEAVLSDRLKRSRETGEYHGYKLAKHEQEVEKAKKNRQASVIIEKVELSEQFSTSRWANDFGEGLEFHSAQYSVTFRIGSSGEPVTVNMPFDDQDFSMADVRSKIQTMVCGEDCCE